MTVITVLGIAALMLVVGYLAFPWLLPQVARSLAPQYGVQQIVVDAQRPGWSSWSIPQVELSTASQIVKAGGIRLTYDPVDLVAGRLISIDVKRLEVELKAAPTADARTANSLDPGLLAALPMQQLRVEELHFLAPEIPLRMHGTLALGEGQLRFRLEASRSPLNAPVRLTARLDADGKFLARFHTSPDKADHALEATGKWVEDSLGIAGTFDFGEYELGLVAALFDLPMWTGFVRGNFGLRLDQAFRPQGFQSQLQFSVLPTATKDIKPLAMNGSIQWLPEPSVAGWNLAVIFDGTQSEGATQLRGHFQRGDVLNTADGSFALLSDDLEILAQVFGIATLKGDVSGTFKMSAGADPELANAQVDAAVKAAVVWNGTTHLNTDDLTISHTPGEPLRWQVSAAPMTVRQQDQGTTLLWEAQELRLVVDTGDPLTVSLESQGDLHWHDGETQMLIRSLAFAGKGQSGAEGYIADLSLTLQGQSIPVHLQVDEAFDTWQFRGPLNWVVRQPLLVSTLGMQSDYDIVGGTFTGNLKGQMNDEALTIGVIGSFAPIEFLQQDRGTTLLWKAQELKVAVDTADPVTFSLASQGDLDWRDGETQMLIKSLAFAGKGRSRAAGYIADLSLTLQGQSIPLRLQVDEDFDTWQFHGPLNWVVRQPLLVSTLGMQSDYDIVGGTLAGNLKGQMKGEALTIDVQGSFKNGALTWDDLVFTGFSSSVVAGLRKDSTMYADLPDIGLASFDPGVPITDVRTGISMQGDLVKFSAISGKLLGGTFAVAPFTYDIARGDASLQVDLTAVDLGAVLSLEGEDLFGEGRLHGQIPVNIVDNEITVTDGTVRNSGKGAIRLAASLAQSVNQPGLDFALRALEDFQYETLEADINYSAKGDLLAAIRLRGRNVLIEKGRPIHYNLNISENLPTLLASLRLQDDVNKSVERRVQQGVTR